MKYYKLHLIRHGLTAGNLDGRYIGSGTDLPLCDEGRAQLEDLKRQFAYPQVSLVFSSPMRRALETSEILFPGVKVIELQDLREMAFGIFENRPLNELVKDPACQVDGPHQSRRARGCRGPGRLLPPHRRNDDETV